MTFVQYCCSAPRCGKTYGSRINLKRHVDVTHLKKKQISCPECHRVFASMQNLREHLNLHSGRKPFVCLICLRRFKQASQLSLHKRKHLLGQPDERESSEEEVYNDTVQKLVESIESQGESSRTLPVAALLLQRPK